MKQITKRKALTGSVGKWSRSSHNAVIPPVCSNIWPQNLKPWTKSEIPLRLILLRSSLARYFFSQYFTAWKSQCTWAGTLGHSTSTAMTKVHTLPRLFKWWSKGWLQHVWFPPQFPPWYYSVTSFHLFGLTGSFNINVGALMDNSSKSCVVS